MRPVVLALVHRDGYDHAESVLPILTAEARSSTPIWYTFVESVKSGMDALQNISKLHEVRLLMTFGEMCSPWVDPETTPSISAFLWPTQVEPIKLLALPALCPAWWDDDMTSMCADTVNTVLGQDLSHFDLVGSSN